VPFFSSFWKLEAGAAELEDFVCKRSLLRVGPFRQPGAHLVSLPPVKEQLVLACV
jgi:hypothetical protein